MLRPGSRSDERLSYLVWSEQVVVVFNTATTMLDTVLKVLVCINCFLHQATVDATLLVQVVVLNVYFCVAIAPPLLLVLY